MKKILFYSPMSLADGAGFQEWLERTAKTLSPSYEVSIIHGTLGERFRWSEEIVEKKFAVCKKVEQVRYFTLFNTFIFPAIGQWRKIYRLIKEQDIVYLNHSFRLHDPLPKILSKLAGKKIILGFHSPFRKTFFRLLYFNLAAWFFRFVDGCHAVNSNMAKMLKGRNARNVYHIPNFLMAENMPEKIHSDFGGEFVFVGRDTHQKGIDLLARAVKNIVKTHPGFKIRFYGTGKQRPIIIRLQERLPKNVEDKGYELDKDKMYKGKKFLVLSSRDEPFGLVVIEAMSYGVPVIATPTNGPLDIIAHEKDGYTASAISVEALTDALLWAMNIDASAYAKISEAAFKKAREVYVEDRFAEKFNNLVNSLFKDRR